MGFFKCVFLFFYFKKKKLIKRCLTGKHKQILSKFIHVTTFQYEEGLSRYDYNVVKPLRYIEMVLSCIISKNILLTSYLLTLSFWSHYRVKRSTMMLDVQRINVILCLEDVEVNWCFKSFISFKRYCMPVFDLSRYLIRNAIVIKSVIYIMF